MNYCGLSGLLIYLKKPFEFITPVTESSHSIHVKWILSLANHGISDFLLAYTHSLVSFVAVIWKQTWNKLGKNLH